MVVVVRRQHPHPSGPDPRPCAHRCFHDAWKVHKRIHNRGHRGGDGGDDPALDGEEETPPPPPADYLTADTSEEDWVEVRGCLLWLLRPLTKLAV
jgi:DNA-directed RNA polymerase specialized sigma24 family protein